MKFKLFINPNSQELVQATVHRKTDFSTPFEQFVLSNGNSNVISAYDDKDLIMLNLDNIMMFTIIENKVFAICNNKQYHIRKRLYQIEEILPTNFWRINKSTIINRFYIHEFKETKTSGVNVIMKNGLSDYVSRRCFSKIRKELN